MFFSLISAIPSLISSLFGSINGITNAIANTKIAQITATTQEEQAVLQSQVETLQARRDVMIAESGKSKINIIVRALLSGGPAILLAKIYVWDKVIGAFYGCSGRGEYAASLGRSCASFTTDALDPNLWKVIMVVLGFYFLYEGADTISRQFAGKS